jgi:CubicO group peptidase (beta-lactamase class C family)
MRCARVGRVLAAIGSWCFLTASAACSTGGEGVSPSPADGSEAGTPSPSCATDLDEQRKTLHVPGLAAAIVKHGKVVCTAAAGYANVEEKRPVTPSSVFWWASVSKPVAATAAMSVLVEGTFKLEDSVNAYLPSDLQVKNPDPACAKTDITFFQLLTHTSSIQEDEQKAAYQSGWVVGKPRMPLGDYLESYLRPGAGHLYSPTESFIPQCPGTKFRYSSIGFGLLGFAVESALNAQDPARTRTTFDRVIQDRVFSKLGMSDSSFTLADFRSKMDRVAMGYRGAGTPAAPFTPVGHHEHANYPDGSMRSSVLDLSKFLAMSIAFGEYEGVRVLPAHVVQNMFAPQVDGLGNDGQGLAWYHDAFGEREDVIGHDGDDPGARSMMFFDPADGAGVLLVANGEWGRPDDDGDPGNEAAKALVERLFAESKLY